MRYIFLGHYFLNGSGYAKIIEELAYGLVANGDEVMILGLGYSGKKAHYHPFKIVPMNQQWIMEALRVLPTDWNADRVILTMDIPNLVEVQTVFTQKELKQELWKMEAIFPIESDPIKEKWQLCLAQFKNRYCISNFGKKLCDEKGLPTYHLPMGCETFEHPPKNKIAAREALGWNPEGIKFLTVAANQERKALPLAIEAFADFYKQEIVSNAHYYLVTRGEASVGWDLQEIINEYKMQDHITIIEKGITEEALSIIYYASDALIISSQAEGACLPIYEAASHGLPVICGTWTGMEDVKEEVWTINIGCDYKYRFPWGNVNRYMASKEDLTRAMNSIYLSSVEQRQELSEAALNFAKQHPWKDTVKVLIDSYEK